MHSLGAIGGKSIRRNESCKEYKKKTVFRPAKMISRPSPFPPSPPPFGCPLVVLHKSQLAINVRGRSRAIIYCQWKVESAFYNELLCALT